MVTNNRTISLRLFLIAVLGTAVLWAVSWVAVFQFNSPIPEWTGPVTNANDRFFILLVTLGVGGIGLAAFVRFFWCLINEEPTTSRPWV